MSTQPPYVLPLPGTGLPRGLSLDVFLQTVVVGVSGLPGTLVRPKWQPEPPKNPPIETDWLALGTSVATPDASAYVGLNGTGEVTTQRHEVLEVPLSIYGPHMYDTYGLLRDGFQLPQNRISLFQANMAFIEISPGRRIPDLVNQRWVDRVECSVFLRREIQRTYPILTFTSASGTIYIPDVSADYQLTFQAQTP